MPLPPDVQTEIDNLHETILLTLALVLKLQERDSALGSEQRAYLTEEVNILIEHEINPRIAGWDEPKLKRHIIRLGR